MARRKAPRRLLRPAARRESDSRAVWLYGSHAVRAALVNPARAKRRLLATRDGLAALEANLARLSPNARCAAGQVASELVPRDRLEAVLPPGAVHQGLALEASPLPAAGFEDLMEAARPRARAAIVVLDRVADPQNLGAVLRSAAAFGASGVVIPDRHTPPESGALAKAASGALETVPLVRVANLARAMEQLKEAGFWCLGFDAAAEDSLAEADLPDKAALVIGAEGAGLRRLTRERCDLLLRVPIGPGAESLNLSAAAAIALWEFARQA